MSEDNNIYEFIIKTELDYNISEAAKRLEKKGNKKSESEINILLKKKSRTDDELKKFLKSAQDKKELIGLNVNGNKILVTRLKV